MEEIPRFCGAAAVRENNVSNVHVTVFVRRLHGREREFREETCASVGVNSAELILKKERGDFHSNGLSDVGKGVRSKVR